MGAFARHSRYGSAGDAPLAISLVACLELQGLRTKPRRAAGRRRRSPRSERTLPLARRHRSAQLRQHCVRQNPPAAQRAACWCPLASGRVRRAAAGDRCPSERRGSRRRGCGRASWRPPRCNNSKFERSPRCHVATIQSSKGLQRSRLQVLDGMAAAPPRGRQKCALGPAGGDYTRSHATRYRQPCSASPPRSAP